ncbi:hypothetical protein GBFDFA_11000 [Edwardsiella anguillarum]|nr:hypothetical protein PBOPBF_10315 [Edwardsiella anguillarum]BET84659.1 hypothetical protein GHNJMD_11315 [Edwardsiella anguillarum]BET88025.1 hypothetical protein GBFDFA_11000 [Edwardsiella anguillarum]BET91316.1 hypothetical protein BIKEJJ_10325 [Edwardsiella anguillarum]
MKWETLRGSNDWLMDQTPTIQGKFRLIITTD